MLLKQIPKYEQRLWDWGVGRGQKSSQVHGRASLHFCEGTPGRKMDVKGNVDDRQKENRSPGEIVSIFSEKEEECWWKCGYAKAPW